MPCGLSPASCVSPLAPLLGSAPAAPQPGPVPQARPGPAPLPSARPSPPRGCLQPQFVAESKLRASPVLA